MENKELIGFLTDNAAIAEYAYEKITLIHMLYSVLKLQKFSKKIYKKMYTTLG